MKMLITSTSCGWYYNYECFKSDYKELCSKFKIEEYILNENETVGIVEINNLDDLLKLCECCGKEIIISKNNYYNDNMYRIEIYDDYRE